MSYSYNPMDYSLPGSSVHGILQARILEWAAVSSRQSSQPRNQTQVSCTAGRLFTDWATMEALFYTLIYIKLNYIKLINCILLRVIRV